MTVNVYGLTFTDVQERELSFLQDVDTTELTASIKRAASDLNVELRALSVVPSDITEAVYPDDYEWCRSTVLFGAAGMYLRTVTGAEEAATVKLSTFAARITRFRDRPQMLDAYNSLSSSALTLRSPANFGDIAASDAARARFLDPSRPDRWRQ